MNDQLNNLDKAHFVKQGSDSRGPGVTSPPPYKMKKLKGYSRCNIYRSYLDLHLDINLIVVPLKNFDFCIGRSLRIKIRSPSVHILI